MSELIARKKSDIKASTIKVSAGAKSKKLEETVEKLSAAKRDRRAPTISASLNIQPAKKIPELESPASVPAATASNSNLRGLRIMSPAPSVTQNAVEKAKDESATIKQAPSKMRARPAPRQKQKSGFSILSGVGVAFTALWCGLAGYYVQDTIGIVGLFAQQPHILGGFLSGILAPVAFLWLIINSFAKGRTNIAQDNSSGKSDAIMSRLNSMMEAQARRFSAIMSDIENKAKNIEGAAKTNIGIPFKSSTSVVAIDQILSKTDDLESRLDQKISSLNNVLDKIDNNLGVSIKRAIDGLNKATSDAFSKTDTVMQEADNKVKTLQKTGKETADTIRVVLEQIDSSTGKMGNSAEAIESRLNKISAVVETQANQIDKAQEKMHERLENIGDFVTAPLARIEEAVKNADAKHAEIEQILDKRVTDLNSASDKAMEKAKLIREDLRMQAQEISTLVGQIAGHSRSVQSVMRAQKEDLDNNIGSALERIESVSTALHGESDKLNDMIQATETRMEGLKTNISDHSEAVAQDTNKVTEELKGLDKIIEGRVRMLLEKSIEANRAVKDVTDSLVDSSDIIDPIYTKATEQIERTRSRFEKMAASFEQGTENNLGKLASMGNIFDDRLNSLSTAAEKAAHILDRSSEGLGSRVDDIDSATKSAQTRLAEMENLFKRQAADIHLTTDQAMMRIENVQKALDDQFHDLTISISESAAQIEDAGAMFLKQSEAITEASDIALDQYNKVGGRTNAEAEKLQKLAQATMTQISAIVGKVKEETINLLDTSDKTLMELQKSGDDFVVQSQTVEKQMNLALENAKKYSRDMGDEADKIGDVADKSADKVAQAVALLAKRLLEVDQSAEKAQSHIEKSREKLEIETDYLADVSIKAAKVVDEAAAAYIRQSHSLVKATQEAESKAKQIKEAENRTQRAHFLNSAQFILESLHSLSVDMTRSFHGKVAEKTWKAYQKGDIAAFTKLLLEQKAQIPMDKMMGKYKDDNEFRTYTNRFIRQFEDICDLAEQNDQSTLLKTTFASSDVAQLYGLLCEAANHDNVFGTPVKKAA